MPERKKDIPAAAKNLHPGMLTEPLLQKPVLQPVQVKALVRIA